MRAVGFIPSGVVPIPYDVVRVLGRRAPPQIADVVVLRVIIPMENERQVVRIREKRFSD